MRDRYMNQVRLLISALPTIARETVFALKGGSAINLFYRDLPRLSVDIDLAYLPVRDRQSSLEDIDYTFDRIAKAIEERNPRIDAYRIPSGGNGGMRIVLREGRAQIKIETSPVMRGSVYPATLMSASKAVVEQFGFVEMNVLAFEDLYAGKLHAALDRQHPRDLFDVKLLYDNEGLTDDLFRVFLVYAASSARPTHELLAPAKLSGGDLYDIEFAGMTLEPVAENVLVETRYRLHSDIGNRLKGDIASFLLSLHDAEPDFDLIGLPEASDLPAVRWKLINLEKLKRVNPSKHAAQRNLLEGLCR